MTNHDRISRHELAVLKHIARPDQGEHTPRRLATVFGTSWQGAASTASSLARKGWVEVIRLPRMTRYQITGAGKYVIERADRDPGWVSEK